MLRSPFALAFVLVLLGSSLCVSSSHAQQAEPAQPAPADPSVEAEQVDPVEPRAAQPDPAQPDEPSEAELELARRRFARGLELAQRGDYGAAASRFREALAVRATPAVRFNLASALYETGDYVESFNHLILVLAEPTLAPDVRTRSEVLVEALGEHVGTLNVSVGGDSQLCVRVDDAPLAPERFGTRFAVVPGVHVVEAYRGDVLVSRRELQVEAGTRALVEMRIVASAEQPPAEVEPRGPTTTPSPSSAERPTGESRRFGVRDWRLWAVVGGAVVAATVAGVAVGLTRDSGASAVPGDFEPAVLSWK